GHPLPGDVRARRLVAPLTSMSTSERPENLGTGAHEDGDAAERYGLVEVGRAIDHPLAVPVVDPTAGREIHVLRPLTEVPDRGDENVVAVEVLFPEITGARIVSVVE